MMSEVIRQETEIFLLSVGHGVFLTFLYDLLRVLRRTFTHGLILVSVEDFLFWITAAFLTFLFAFQNTDGLIRGYTAVGITIGVILYHVTVSNIILKTAVLLCRILKRLFTAAGHTLSKPVKKIWQIWQKMIEFARKKGYNAIKMRGTRPDGGSGEDICENEGIVPNGLKPFGAVAVRERFILKRGRQYGRKEKAAKQK